MSTKTPKHFLAIMDELRAIYDSFDLKPIACEYGRQGATPFKILISTVLSLRTKDPTTLAATERLWQEATTPHEMLVLGEDRIAELVYPVGFYRRKSKQIIQISQILLEQHKGKVPPTAAQMMKLPGVGLKTANLVAGISFGEPKICVDIHVHRIANRLGWITTETPEETEKALMQIIPQDYWIELNDVLVAYGQNICSPVSPFCETKCVIADKCPRIAVSKHR